MDEKRNFIVSGTQKVSVEITPMELGGILFQYIFNRIGWDDAGVDYCTDNNGNLFAGHSPEPFPIGHFPELVPLMDTANYFRYGRIMKLDEITNEPPPDFFCEPALVEEGNFNDRFNLALRFAEIHDWVLTTIDRDGAWFITINHKNQQIKWNEMELTVKEWKEGEVYQEPPEVESIGSYTREQLARKYAECQGLELSSYDKFYGWFVNHKSNDARGKPVPWYEIENVVNDYIHGKFQPEPREQYPETPIGENIDGGSEIE